MGNMETRGLLKRTGTRIKKQLFFNDSKKLFGNQNFFGSKTNFLLNNEQKRPECGEKRRKGAASKKSFCRIKKTFCAGVDIESRGKKGRKEARKQREEGRNEGGKEGRKEGKGGRKEGKKEQKNKGTKVGSKQGRREGGKLFRQSMIARHQKYRTVPGGRLCRSFSVQVGTPNPPRLSLGNPWLQEMRRIVSEKRLCRSFSSQMGGGCAPPNRPAFLRQSMIARIDKCRVVAMLAVREGCVCTGRTLCHSFCFYMGGLPPPQPPAFSRLSCRCHGGSKGRLSSH